MYKKPYLLPLDLVNSLSMLRHRHPSLSSSSSTSVIHIRVVASYTTPYVVQVVVSKKVINECTKNHTFYPPLLRRRRPSLSSSSSTSVIHIRVVASYTTPYVVVVSKKVINECTKTIPFKVIIRSQSASSSCIVASLLSILSLSSSTRVMSGEACEGY
jgi:hypothetical protein